MGILGKLQYCIVNLIGIGWVAIGRGDYIIRMAGYLEEWVAISKRQVWLKMPVFKGAFWFESCQLKK